MKELRLTGPFADRMKFVENPHGTFFDGVRLPGVSEILNKCGLFDTFSGPPGYAAQRGTYIHEAIAMKLRDELDEETLDDNIRGYYEAALKYLDDHGLEPIFVEQTVVGSADEGKNEILYGGNLDLVSRNDDKVIYVTDWKAGQVAKDRYRAQIGGYYRGLLWTLFRADCENNSDGLPSLPQPWPLAAIWNEGRVVFDLVQLKENGKYKVENVDPTVAIRLWEEACAAFIENGGL